MSETNPNRTVIGSRIEPTPNVPLQASTTPDKSVKSASPDIIITDPGDTAVDLILKLTLEKIGAQELISLVRHDTVNGQNVLYQPVKNISEIAIAYNPQNIIAIPDTSDMFFKNFAIKLDSHIPQYVLPANNVIFDAVNQRIIIEFTGLKRDYEVEVQTVTAGRIFDDTRYIESYVPPVEPPEVLTVPLTPPAPRVRSVAGEERDYVTITAPTSDGGSDITQYNWESGDGKSGSVDAPGEFTVNQEAGTSQTYRVRAVNSIGASPWSADSESITTPTAITVPAKPPAPTVRSVGTEQNDYVTIFAPVSNGGSSITQYNWESNDGKSGNRNAVGEFVVAQEAGTSQSYRVRAVNGIGASEWSDYSTSVTTPAPPFFPPYFPYFPYFPVCSGCDCCGASGCGYCYVPGTCFCDD